MSAGRINQLESRDNSDKEQNGLYVFGDPTYPTFSVDANEEIDWTDLVETDGEQFLIDASEVVMGFDELGAPLYYNPEEFDEYLPSQANSRQPLDDVIDSVARNVQQEHSGQMESIPYSQHQNTALQYAPVVVPGSHVAANSKKQQATIANCSICGVLLKHPSKIQAHMRTHTGERPFVCDICGQRFTQQTPLRNHVKRHVGDTKFECSYGCGKKFVSNSVRNGHELRIHLGVQRQGPPRPHLKPTRRTAPSPTELEAIQQPAPPVIEWQRPIGDISPLTATASKRMDDIISAVATGSDTGGAVEPRAPRRGPLVAQCEVCGLLLKHPSKIQAHMRTHSGERPFKCPHCDLSFSTTNPLKVHIRRVHTRERPFICEQWGCGRRFVSKSAMREHQRVVHEGFKRYQCTIGNCRRLFTRRCYLLKHHTTDHPGELMVEGEWQADGIVGSELPYGEESALFANEEWIDEYAIQEFNEGDRTELNPHESTIAAPHESFYDSQGLLVSDGGQIGTSYESLEYSDNSDLTSALIEDEEHPMFTSDGVVLC